MSAFIKDDHRTTYDFKRHCIEHSIYGVDIDAGATEIAKLRLWLSLIVDEDDIKQIKPLPNLDYKIVCGNSLLGVKRDLLNNYLFSDLEKTKHLYFNETNPTKKQAYKNQIDELISKITDGHREFDFQVYFSEVFHHKKGFDIEIGNPPYIRQEDLKPIKPLLQKHGYEVYNSTSDIYTYFYEKGYQVLREGGHLVFITSNKWMRAKYGEKLRKFFKEKTVLKQIIDFGGHKVFESATVDTNIIIFQKTPVGAGLVPAQINNQPGPAQINNQPVRAGLVPAQTKGQPQGLPLRILTVKSDFNHDIDLSEYFNQNAIAMKQSDLDNKCFTFGDDAVLRLKKKIEQIGTPLKDWDVRIYRGIVTGFNEAFIIDNETKERLCKEDPKSAEILKPILRSRDISRYSYKWAGLWVIATFPSFRLDIDNYPAIKNHLLKFGIKRLEQSGEKGSRKRQEISGLRHKIILLTMKSLRRRRLCGKR
ncbi:MAG: Eco57I restriction-modification methylase domain-containing protein [Thermodesulfovibrionales bacterium]